MVKQRPNWLNWRNGVSLGVGLVVLGIAIALATGTLKAGIGASTTTVTSDKTDSQGKVIERTTTRTPQEAKTLWDLFNLAGVVAVPIVLGVLGFQLQAQQQKRNEEQLQEEILQNYYDKVSALLVEKNLLAISVKQKIHILDAKPDTTALEERELLDVSVDVIRARTIATLRRLDGSRKSSLIGFLIEAEVIEKLKLSLQKADLRFADLRGADLRLADLRGADLRLADLRFADLRGANFRLADLRGANLSFASLIDADLSRAILNITNLVGVDLSRAILCSANLNNTDLSLGNLSFADFRDANLSGANLSFADLIGSDLRGAKLGGVNLRLVDLIGSDLRGADLSRADLREVMGLIREQLEGELPPYLCNTKLPKGIDIDPNRDCDRLKRDPS